MKARECKENNEWVQEVKLKSDTLQWGNKSKKRPTKHFLGGGKIIWIHLETNQFKTFNK